MKRNPVFAFGCCVGYIELRMKLLRKSTLCISVPVFISLASLTSCSREKPDTRVEQAANPEPRSATTLPFTVTVVETPELLINRKLRKEARELFAAKNYEKLEQLAREYRESKQSGPEGLWDLGEVYEGTQIPKSSDDNEWTAHFAALREWVRARPQSITARVSLAKALLSYAWKARGGGYANTVTEQSARQFGERLGQAVKVLQDAQNLKERCPAWWSMMMRAALGLGIEKSKYNSMFEKAVSEYPDYPYYYCARAWFLLPRWYGEVGEWEADLVKSADKLGSEDGDLLYARVVWDMQGFHQNVFKENQLSWERVDRGLQIMENRYKDSLGPKSIRAYLAALGADRATARKYFARLEGKVDLVVWDNEDTFKSVAETVYGK